MQSEPPASERYKKKLHLNENDINMQLTTTKVGSEMMIKFHEVHILIGFLVVSITTLIVDLNVVDISVQLDSYRLNDNCSDFSAKRLPK